MDQFSNVLLAIDKAHSTTDGPGLQTKLRWVKPGLWAHSDIETVWGMMYSLHQLHM